MAAAWLPGPGSSNYVTTWSLLPWLHYLVFIYYIVTHLVTSNVVRLDLLSIISAKNDETSESNNYTVLYQTRITSDKEYFYTYGRINNIIYHISTSRLINNNIWMDMSHQMNKIATINTFACLTLTYINWLLVEVLHHLRLRSTVLCSQADGCRPAGTPAKYFRQTVLNYIFIVLLLLCNMHRSSCAVHSLKNKYGYRKQARILYPKLSSANAKTILHCLTSSSTT